ncbi:MAG: hypothetical protein ACP5VQ_08130 [Phycisphaerae bacterium]
MMRWKIITLVFILAATGGTRADLHAAGTHAAAAPMAPTKLNPAQVPADAKWIIYLNLDQTMRSPAAGKLLADFLRSHPMAQNKVKNLEKVMGVKFPRDFHDILILGREIGSKHGVVVIHASANQQVIEKFFKRNSTDIQVTTATDGVYKIVDRRGDATYEVSPSTDTFVVSRSKKSLMHELHVLAGKAAGMATTNPLLSRARHDIIMYLADINMLKLADGSVRRHSPAWMKSVTGAWLAVRVKKEKLAVLGRLELINADSAARIVQMVQGWQAAMDLGGTSPNASPRQRFMAGVANRLNVGSIGKDIRIRWTMSLAKLLAGPQKRAPAPP